MTEFDRLLKEAEEEYFEAMKELEKENPNLPGLYSWGHQERTKISIDYLIKIEPLKEKYPEEYEEKFVKKYTDK